MPLPQVAPGLGRQQEEEEEEEKEITRRGGALQPLPAQQGLPGPAAARSDGTGLAQQPSLARRCALCPCLEELGGLGAADFSTVTG